jgi:YVTN family beta-propeller protein
MSPLLVVGHWLNHVDSTLDLKSEAASNCDLTATRSSLREKRLLAVDGTTAYVSSENDNLVTAIDVATNTRGGAIPVGTNPIGIAITPASAVQVPTGAIGGILLTGLVALVFVGYQLTRGRPSAHAASCPTLTTGRFCG